MSRFIVVEGSQSAHCCFDATVVDTTKQRVVGEFKHYLGQFESVCECFNQDDADMIAAALNAAVEPE